MAIGFAIALLLLLGSSLLSPSAQENDAALDLKAQRGER